jgi:hypothetical protein
MEFLLGDGPPPARLVALFVVAARKRPPLVDMLFQRNPHDSRDDARAGYKRAAQST